MSTLRHEKENHKSVVLQGKEFELLKEMLSHLEDTLWWNKPYITEYTFTTSVHIELSQEEIMAFYGILRAVNRSTSH